MNNQQLADSVLGRAVRSGHGRSDRGYNDDKELVTIAEMEALLAVGAKESGEAGLNAKQIGGTYRHDVNYGDHNFVAVSEEPYEWGSQRQE